MRVCIIGGSAMPTSSSKAWTRISILVVGVAPDQKGRCGQIFECSPEAGQLPQYYEDYRKMLDELKLILWR